MSSPVGPEERERATLVAQLRAVQEDIDRARETARRANAGLHLGHTVRRSSDPVVRGEHVRLPDGAEIVIRPIEPGDRPELAAGFARLSSLSRFRRFRRSIEHLTSSQLRELTEVDHTSHEALAAFDAAAGAGIGVARFVRSPADPAQAEVTCTVTDAWQGRGVGSALVERLAARARALGVERFTMSIVVGNEPARRLLAHVADELSEHRDGGEIEILAGLD